MKTQAKIKPLSPQEQFLKDIEQAITRHPYYDVNLGETEHKPKEDQITMEVHDPNGEYERIKITIDLIA